MLLVLALASLMGAAGFASSFSPLPADCGQDISFHGDSERAALYSPVSKRYILHIVVHVVHTYRHGWIAHSCVEDGIQQLNANFAAANLSFVLAKIDPFGQPTDGVIYHNNFEFYNTPYLGTDALVDSMWDPRRFVNIWLLGGPDTGRVVAGVRGSVGIASTPQMAIEAGGVDGLVLEGSLFGPCAYARCQNAGQNILTRGCDDAAGGYGGATLASHEMGHFLGLRHTFDEDKADTSCVEVSPACYETGDLVCDTPAQAQSHNAGGKTRGCAVDVISCGSPDSMTNFMDYNSDPCMQSFTAEQMARMRCTLMLYRPGLLVDAEAASVEHSSYPPLSHRAKGKLWEDQQEEPDSAQAAAMRCKCKARWTQAAYDARCAEQIGCPPVACDGNPANELLPTVEVLTGKFGQGTWCELEEEGIIDGCSLDGQWLSGGIRGMQHATGFAFCDPDSSTAATVSDLIVQSPLPPPPAAPPTPPSPPPPTWPVIDPCLDPSLCGNAEGSSRTCAILKQYSIESSLRNRLCPGWESNCPASCLQ